MKRKHTQDCTLYVEGMHCGSCEVLIEKKLQRFEQVEAVDASLAKHQVQVQLKPGTELDLKQINQDFAELGYSFSRQKTQKKEAPLVQIADNGALVFNASKVRQVRNSLLVAAGILLAFFVIDGSDISRYASVDASSSWPAFLALGIVAGLSSCAALVGGLLLSLTKQWHELHIVEDSLWVRAQPHVLFHIGRLLAFFVFGGLLGVLGSVISFNTSFIGLVTVGVSLIMILLALQMLGVAWAQRIKLAAPKFIGSYVSEVENFQGRFMPFVVGAATFVMPCGFTLLAQGVALTTGNFWTSALAMLAFAVGTMTTLVPISYSGLLLTRRPQLTAKFMQVAGLVVLFFAVYNINSQLNVLGFPSLSDIRLDTLFAQSASNVSADFAAVDTDGKQIIRLTATDLDYIPQGSTKLKAGVPAKLIVDNQGVAGCAAFLAARGLFPSYLQLRNGQNIREFTPQPGTYKITCTMGMVRPVIVTVV